MKQKIAPRIPFELKILVDFVRKNRKYVVVRKHSLEGKLLRRDRTLSLIDGQLVNYNTSIGRYYHVTINFSFSFF